MNITKDNTGDLTATLTIDIAPDDYMPKVNESLEKIRKKANIPGFRPGKAPMGLVKRQYSKSTILDEVNTMAFENIYKYVQDEKLQIIGRPLINVDKTPQIDDLTEDKTYSFVFDIGMLPEFDVMVTPELEVEYKKVEVTEEALEKEVEALRNKHASYDKSGEIVDGCMVTGTMNFISPGSENVVQDEENDPKESLFRYFYLDKLDENPKIKEKFVGAKTNDVIEIKTEDIDDPETLKFLIPDSIDINQEGIEMTFVPAESYVSKKADLDQDFFEKTFPGRNISDETEFRALLSHELQRHFNRQCDDIFLHTCRKKLLKDTNLPLPAEFVKRFLIENSKEENEEKITDLEEKFDEYLEAIRWEFIQDKIFSQFDIKIVAEDFKNYIRDYYKDYMQVDEVSDEQVQKELKQILEDKKTMNGIEESIRRKKTIEVFKSNLTLKEVEFASFEEMAEQEEKEEKQEQPEKQVKTENKQESSNPE
jgi:trigger factor